MPSTIEKWGCRCPPCALGRGEADGQRGKKGRLEEQSRKNAAWARKKERRTREQVPNALGEGGWMASGNMGRFLISRFLSMLAVLAVDGVADLSPVNEVAAVEDR